MTDVLASLHPKPVPARSSTEDPRAIQHDYIDPVDSGQFWSSDEGPTFAEFLDIINPLQHIPVVSTIYPAITGDQIGPGPRFLGGALFGGPAGAIGAGIASLFEEASGSNLGEHIAELVNDITGGSDEEENTPTVAAADTNAATGLQVGINAAPQTGPNVVQAATLAGAAITPAAVHLNRIAFNPNAAMGLYQGPAENKTAGLSASTAKAAFTARPMAVPFGTPNTAHPPTTHTRTPEESDLRQGVFNSSDAAANRAEHAPAHSTGKRETIAAPQVSNAVTRSQRQQADLMLAQWAAQQMALQNSPSPSGAQNDDTGRTLSRTAATAGTSPAHPMLPPRNASPEWYAQAMNQALNSYQSGANTGAGATPAISLRR